MAKNFSFTAISVAILVLLVMGAVLVWKVSQGREEERRQVEERDERQRSEIEQARLRQRAAEIAVEQIKQREREWPDRAARAAERMLSQDPQLASQILSLTHPTGVNPRIVEVWSKCGGGTVKVTAKLDWKGGIMGGSYSSVICWTLSRAGHQEAVVTVENAAIRVDENHQKMLNGYFRDTLYPYILKRVEREELLP